MNVLASLNDCGKGLRLGSQARFTQFKLSTTMFFIAFISYENLRTDVTNCSNKTESCLRGLVLNLTERST